MSLCIKQESGAIVSVSVYISYTITIYEMEINEKPVLSSESTDLIKNNFAYKNLETTLYQV